MEQGAASAPSRSSFMKTVEKHAGRAKERLLQNLGKFDKTKDEIFDEYTQNFNKQQKMAEKYHREIKNYVSCAKAVEASIQNLIEIVSEIYEDEWANKTEMIEALQKLMALQNFYNHKLHEEILGSVNSYLNQFPEIKNKVAKRGRKLVDYDSARHNLEALKSHKKKEEAKIQKAKEQLEEARQTFEPMNAELLEELPALYNSRIPFYASNLQSLFSAEMTYHHDSGVIYNQLSELIDKLALENQKGIYDAKRKLPPENLHLEISHHDKPEATEREVNGEASSPSEENEQNDLQSKSPPPNSEDKNPFKEESPVPPKEEEEESIPVAAKVESQIEIPPGATTTNLPPGVLYRVKATYKYNAEDSDELSFEKDDIINVVEYEDPEEKEEGWLMGIHQSSLKKGLFPANFTKPI